MKFIYVIMPFEEPYDTYYKEIYSEIFKNTDYVVKREDSFTKIGDVIQNIKNNIINADIIVCDTSTKNANVFYEYGLADSIGKKVILISDDISNIPFDLRHLRYIIYNFTPENVKEKEEKIKKFKNELLETLTEIESSKIDYDFPASFSEMAHTRGKISFYWHNIIKAIAYRLKFPIKGGFTIIFLTAMAAGVIGGVFSSLFLHSLGGNNGEPKGINSIIWALITGSIIILAAYILNIVYKFSRKRYIALFSTLFTSGLVIGSLIFYNFPISSFIGFRKYFEATIINKQFVEIILVLIWTALLGIIPLFSAFIYGVLMANHKIKLIKGLIKYSILCILITSAIIFIYIIIFPDIEKFETGRGIIAGISLRTILFLGYIELIKNTFI